MDLKRVGVWTFAFELQPWSAVARYAAELEDMGWGAIWVPEAVGREALAQSAMLLGATRSIVIATGIANIYARDAMTSATGHLTLEEAYPGRFLFGLGVSHAHLVHHLRGHDYSKPYTKMVAYLDAMEKVTYISPRPASPPQLALAALGPKMLALAAERTWGAHPYFVPVAHTAEARRVMGSKGKLAPEQAFVLETDPVRARAIAREHMEMYLRAPNYINNLKRLGYADEDIANGGSDRLVDDIVVWGTPEQVAERVAAHHAAGADHVCLQALSADPKAFPIDAYRVMAKHLPV
ncbi:MAG: TIGR03620 family F420-dependent LLM class oxidoreductase [Proteobacteria bacterium]|nr:TIGR03620 family F420-dependent LLM class oxidoreductase [Pseudomonadota bacterium]